METHPSSSPAGTPRAHPPGRRRTGAAGVATLLALGLVPVLPGTGGAQAAVTVGSNISVYPDRDMVVAIGYTAGEQLLVEVLRGDVVIGTTQGPAGATQEGVGLEVNHGAEGAPLPGDCWTGYTPDILGGDVVRVTPVDRPGTPVVDTTTVKDLAFSGAPVLEADRSVSVSGTATPGTDFVVEFRRDNPEPRFRRGPFVPVFEAGTSNWKATFSPTGTSSEGLTEEQQRQIALTEASWLAVADGGTETTLAELGEPGGVADGCTGTADPNNIASGYLEPVNVTSGDIVLSGTAREDVSNVSIEVGALPAKAATLSDNVTGTKTWTLPVTKAELATLPDGDITITPTFGAVTGTSRTMHKDTVAPAAPTATPEAGVYAETQNVALVTPTGESLGKIYWEIGSPTTVREPDASSNQYSSQIAVSSTQTITARVIDPAGNLGAVGTFDYRIGTPPGAPTGVTATEALKAVEVSWSPVSGATSYDVYREAATTPLNSAPLTGTSFTDSDLAYGSYSYVVRAVGANGIESAASAVASATLASPAVPTGLTATPGDGRVTLAWTRNTETDLAGYVLAREGRTAVDIAETQSAHVDTGLTNGTPYTYTLLAVDDAGNRSAPTGSVQATPAPPPVAAPGAPTIGTATAGDASATVHWTAPSDDGGSAITGYTVRAHSGTTLVSTTPAAAGATSVVVGSLVNGTTYTFDVAATNSAGTGSFSASSAAVTPTAAPPPAPSTRTVVLDPTADTTVRQSSANTAYGSSTTLLSDGQASSGTSSRETAYLRFTVPTLAAGESITGATLSLNYTNGSSNGPEIYPTDPSWNEGTMTWNSGQPTRTSSTAIGDFGGVSTGRKSTSVTGLTTAGDVSFQLYADSNDGVDLSSREATAANRPQLHLTITSP